MHPKSFKAELLSGHKENAAQVPFDPGAAWSMQPQALWPGRRGFPALATLNDVAFESVIVARSKKFWLLVPTAISESANISVGSVGAFTLAPNYSFKPRPLRGSA